MPGPGSKQKSKQKIKKTTTPTTSRIKPSSSQEVALLGPPEGIVGAVADASGWTAIADILIKLFGLPDISTRSGLKKIHKNFDEVCRRLEYAYNQFQENGKIAAGIVGIYTQMSADAILRDRLIKERDLLTKIFTLLDRPDVCLVAVQCLGAMTHHGGKFVRLEIAKRMPILMRLLEEYPSNGRVAELTIAVISHTAAVVLDTDKTPDPKLFKLFDVPRLLRLIITHMAKPTSTDLLIGHASEFFTYAPWSCAKEVLAYPSAMNFLVAMTRSNDFELRWSAMLGLLRACLYNVETEDVHLDPYKLMAAVQRGTPGHLSDAMFAYGPQRCDMFLMMSATRDYQGAMVQIVQDHDYLKLGRTLARLILSTEFSVADGMFQTQDPRTGRIVSDNAGLPFTSYLESLPLCANELRKTGNSADIDNADIIELKYLVVRARFPEARLQAKRAAERNPRVGFFYYVQTLGADKVEGLRVAKKGLKCPNLTGYVRFALLFRGAEHAMSLAMDTLQRAQVDEKTWEEGIALLVSSYEDSKTFVEEAPPDGRSMSSVLYYHAILTMILKGSEISPDMNELQDNVRKLKIADDFTRFFGRRVSNTQLRAARAALFDRMPNAWKEWGDVVMRFEASRSERELKGDIEKEAAKPEMGLEKWFERMEMSCDGEGCTHDHNHDGPSPQDPGVNDDEKGGPAHVPLHHGARHERHRVHPKVNPNTVELYRCTWCKNPSAALRKCSGCEKTRYCDGSCQKLHWTGGHKKECKKAT